MLIMFYRRSANVSFAMTIYCYVSVYAMLIICSFVIMLSPELNFNFTYIKIASAVRILMFPRRLNKIISSTLGSLLIFWNSLDSLSLIIQNSSPSFSTKDDLNLDIIARLAILMNRLKNVTITLLPVEFIRNNRNRTMAIQYTHAIT